MAMITFLRIVLYIFASGLALVGADATDEQTSPAGSLFYFDDDATLRPEFTTGSTAAPIPSSPAPAVSSTVSSTVTTILTSPSPFVVVNKTTSESPTSTSASSQKASFATKGITVSPAQQWTSATTSATTPVATFPPPLTKDPIGTRFFL